MRSPQTDPAIIFTETVVRLSNNFVLGPITFAIPMGMSTVILGPSGSGKSSLLRTIIGLLQPTSGIVAVNPAMQPGASPPGLSVVFQDYALYPHMSVRRNAVLSFQSSKPIQKERRDRLQALDQTLGLRALLERLPGTLSGGEQQRAAILKTLVSGAPLWLMDEPLSNLDAHIRLQIRTCIRESQRSTGATLVVVTHDLHDAVSLADHLAVVSDGRIAQEGRPADVIRTPATLDVARLVDDPPPNELALRIRTSGNDPEVSVGEGVLWMLPRNMTLALGAANTSLIAVVRADDVCMENENCKGEGSLHLDGRVCVVEAGYRTAVIETASSAGRVRFRTASENLPALGDTVLLHIPWGAVQLFDPTSGNSVMRPE